MNEIVDVHNADSPGVAVRVARHVTWVGFVVNAVLGVGKILAGLFGRSSAMIADGVHSFSDLITDIIVLVFVGIGHRRADKKHQYGHGKFETFATMMLAVILGIVGVLFFAEGLSKTLDALHGSLLPQPSWIALIVAVLSVLSKEWLYRYTRRAGERIGSTVVVANAWHHRSDALSSVATLAGVGGAIFFGARWRVLDPVAAMLVSVFIVVAAVKICSPAVKELLEASLPDDVVGGMCRIIGDTPGVDAFHHFASRRNGSMMIVDFHIKVNPRITVEQAHVIACEVESRLRAAYGRNLLVNIHIEPYHGQPVNEVNMCE